MNMTYTYDMKALAILAAIAALILAMMLPISAHAKAKGDTIGAQTKEATTGTSHADMADGLIPAYFYTTEVSKTATTTHTITKSEKCAQIKELKAEIKRLQKLIKQLSK